MCAQPLTMASITILSGLGDLHAWPLLRARLDFDLN